MVAETTIVKVGGWEHECCGAAFERDEVVELCCFEIPEGGDRDVRLIETHHDLSAAPNVVVRGLVVDISIRHPDGSIEPLERLPSGRALRGFGFDDHDDGRLVRPWTGETVTADSDEFLITIAN